MLNVVGQEILEKINKKFGVKIEVTEENARWIEDLCEDITKDLGYGFCQDCDDRRMPDEPRHNEGWD